MSSKEIRGKFLGVSWFLSRARDAWLDVQDLLSNKEYSQIYRKIRPYTLCGNARLRCLYAAVRRIAENNIPGDLVECGTARGGSAALMGLTAKSIGAKQILWVFDTFEGLPPPTSDDSNYEVAKRYTGACYGSLDDVAALFKALDISAETKLVKGLFQNTLAAPCLDSIALLHIDADWYTSVKICLERLYDRVSPGGIIQFDDYGHWPGARKAVDEFLRARSIDSPLRYIDYTGRQLIKPS
jgi:O-methyltransferase